MIPPAERVSVLEHVVSYGVSYNKRKCSVSLLLSESPREIAVTRDLATRRVINNMRFIYELMKLKLPRLHTLMN